MTVAAIASSSCAVIRPVVSCEPTMFTRTRTSEPACSTLPGVTPTALALKIFSTAVRPWSGMLISLFGAKTGSASTPRVCAAKVCSFLPKTMA